MIVGALCPFRCAFVTFLSATRGRRTLPVVSQMVLARDRVWGLGIGLPNHTAVQAAVRVARYWGIPFYF